MTAEQIKEEYGGERQWPPYEDLIDKVDNIATGNAVDRRTYPLWNKRTVVQFVITVVFQVP